MTDYPIVTDRFFSDENLRTPWPLYKQIRDKGPVVKLAEYDCLAVGRYDDVRSILMNDRVFSSSKGVGLNDSVNDQMQGSIIASDGESHDVLRKVAIERLTVKAMRAIEQQVQDQADALIDSLVGIGAFDGVAKLTQRFPMTIVAEMIGMDEEGKSKVIEWADISFNLFGSAVEPRTTSQMERMGEVFEYAFRTTNRESLRPGSLGDAIIDAVEAGRIQPQQGPRLLVAYLTGGLDTTIAGLSNLIVLLSENPDQWNILKNDQNLVPDAINEMLRITPPAHWFSRSTLSDAEIGGILVPEGSRILPLLGAANRDERKFEDPDKFDIARKKIPHLAFGFGKHVCAGQFLAKLEMNAILHSMIRKVERIEVLDAQLGINNIIHGHAKLDMALI